MRYIKGRIQRFWLAERSRVFYSLAVAMLLWAVCLAVFGPLWRMSVQAATATNPWLNTAPTLTPSEGVTGGLPETIASAGNIPCTTKTFQWRIGQSTVVCAVLTSAGLIAPGGFTNVYGRDARLSNSAGGQLNIIAIPHRNDAVVLENTSQGTKLHYYNGITGKLRSEYNAATKELQVFLEGSPDWTLQDRSGQHLYIRPESLAFSNNGQWLVVDSPRVAMLVVDLLQKVVKPVQPPYVYHVGLAVFPHIAISDDGSTVLSSSERGDFTIVDTTTCSPVPEEISKPAQCQLHNLQQYMQSKIPGYSRIFHIRFMHDTRVRLYVRSSSGGSMVLSQYQLAPSEEAVKNLHYLALGDSFASGEGAYDYFTETDTKENKCHLSRRSYPFLIGKQLGLHNFNSVACSGARIPHILSEVQKPETPRHNDQALLLPGTKKQIEFIRERSPNTITIGIGGNDVGLISRMKACLAPGTCYQSYEDRLEIVREVNRQFDNLVTVYQQTRREANAGTRIYALGYPQVIKPGGSCAVNVRLDDEEALLANQFITYLNSVIARAAQTAGVQYLDVANAFNGHRMCEVDTRLSALNGITLGNDIPDELPDRYKFIGNESFHPNRFGHELYRQAIIEKSSSFTVPLPPPQQSAPPGEDPSLEILQAPKSQRQVKQTVFDPQLTTDYIRPGVALDVQFNALQYSLLPGTVYSIEIHSSPIVLGTFVMSEQEPVKSSIRLPENMQPGIHTIHVMAQNMFKEPIDIYKTIEVVTEEAAPMHDIQSTSQQHEDSTLRLFGGSHPADTHSHTLSAHTQPVVNKIKHWATGVRSTPVHACFMALAFGAVGLWLLWLVVARFRRK